MTETEAMTDEGREPVGIVHEEMLDYYRHRFAEYLWWVLGWGMHRAVEYIHEVTEEQEKWREINA